MKKIFIIFFMICTGMNLFSQNYDYGLSQDDLNLLLGFYVPDIENLKKRGREWSFSWGNQTVIETNTDSVQIDYNASVRWDKIDKKYENHLLIRDSGYMNFIITDIEKLSANKFKLSIFSMQYYQIWGLKDEGYIIITFLDNVHASIDTANCTKGFFRYGVLWKCAGPTVSFE